MFALLANPQAVSRNCEYLVYNKTFCFDDLGDNKKLKSTKKKQKKSDLRKSFQ